MSICLKKSLIFLISVNILCCQQIDENQVPDKPSGLRAKPTSNAIFVSWAPPRNQNIMIRGYTIGWGIGFPDVYTKVLDGKQRLFTIDNLQPLSEYVISLRAFNQVGDGQPIYETVKTWLESKPEPELPMVPPVGLKAMVLSASSMVLYWTDTTLPKIQVVGDNRYYTIRYTSYVHSNNPKYRYFNSSELNCMIDDLKANTQYEFSVKVLKGKRESQWSMSVFNTTYESAPSSPPRDLTVVPSTISEDPTVINLHWQPPKQPNGQITGYVIFYTTDNTQRDRDWVVEGVIGDKMTTTLKKLLPNQTYYFKIQARNNKGYGPLSPEVSFRTLTALPGSLGHNHIGELNLSTNTLYYTIAGISGVTVLLLIVVGTMLCRSRRNSGYIRKPKGYTAAAQSPGGKTPQMKVKGRELNPPDLWIHHDQMELKALEKAHNGDPTMTVTPIVRNSQDYNNDTLEKEKKIYSDSLYDDISKGATSPSDTSLSLSTGTGTGRRSVRSKPITMTSDHSSPQNSHQNGSISLEPSTALSRPLYLRTQFSHAPRAHVTLDAVDNSVSGSSHVHHLYDPVSSPHLHMGIGGNNLSGSGHIPSNPLYGSSGGPQVIPVKNSSLTNTLGKRPFGHPLKSFSVPAPPNSTPSTSQSKQIAVRPQFNSSPLKKVTPGSSMSGQKSTHVVNPSMRGAELLRREETASCSTENLSANLEGLMKDLNAITASEFEC